MIFPMPMILPMRGGAVACSDSHDWIYWSIGAVGVIAGLMAALLIGALVWAFIEEIRAQRAAKKYWKEILK